YHFCKGVRIIDDGAIVETSRGQVYFGITSERDVGVLDWWCGPSMETAERWPTRVIALPDGTSLYEVTAIFGPAGPPPGIDQHFGDELGALKRLAEEQA